MANEPNLYRDDASNAKEFALTGKKVAKSEEKRPLTPTEKRVRAYWKEIERYKRATSAWMDEGKIIEQLYLDQDRLETSAVRRFALLWANVETLKPAVYAKLPVVQCSRRYRDRDPVARTAAELIERATNTGFELYDVDEVFQAVRDDRLLPGRGQVWVRYEATIEVDEGETLTGAQPQDLDKTKAEEPKPSERLTDERFCVDYVHWADFGHNVAPVWRDVWLVWRSVYKTKEEMATRFGDDIAAQVSYNAKVPANLPDRQVTGDSSQETADEFCRVVECWDKRARKVTWITEGHQGALDDGEPPINFSAFFPCPRPCYATKTSRSLIPRPDYVFYRDQAKEINDLTDKIGNMMEWLIVKAFVPAAPSRVADAIEETLRESSNRELFTQVESWQEWTEKGGAGKLIDWLPLDMIIKGIQSAIAAREQLIQDVFQITGISDILRGQTDANETLGAQELKAQTGSRRLRNTKDDLARMCRDTGRLCAEVVAEKFEPETIAALTGYRYQPAPAPQPGVQVIGGNGGPPLLPAPSLPGASPMPAGSPLPGLPVPAPVGLPQAVPGVPGLPGPTPPTSVQPSPEDGPKLTFGDDVMDLLRDDRLRSFRIDIETDSTGQADDMAEQQRATEFVTAVGGFMEKAATAMQTAPELAPVMSEMLEFTARRFRAGRGLEETIEKSFQELAKRVQTPADPQPTPEQLKAKADVEAQQQKMAADQQKHDQQMQAGQQKMLADQAIAAAKLAEIQAQAAAARELHEMRMAELVEEQELARIKEANAMQDAARRSAETANTDGRID